MNNLYFWLAFLAFLYLVLPLAAWYFLERVSENREQKKGAQLENATAVRFTAREWITIWNVGVTPYMSLNPVVFDGRGFNRVNQVTTEADLQALSKEFNLRGKPALMDEEHFHRLENGSSAALGWIVETKVEDGKLQARVEWTQDGLDMVESGKLRYVSPVLDCKPRSPEELDKPIPEVYPASLLNAGLTNTPRNLTLPPVSDAPSGAAIFANRNEFTADGSAHENKPNQTPEKTMNKIAQALGLPEDATEEEILAAIKALNDAAIAAAEQAAVETVNSYKDVIPAGKTDFYKGVLLSNRETGLAILEDLKASKGTPAAETTPAPVRVFNRSAAAPAAVTGKTAAEKPEKDRTAQEHAATFNSMAPSAERSAYYDLYKKEIKRGQTALA
jgi:phage I-like protein